MWLIRKMFYNPERERLIDVRIHSKFGVRHVQVLLCVFLLLIGYTMRVVLSVAIVAMTDRKASSNTNIPTYNWTDTGTILSSFFWGYIVLQVFAGWCAKNYGPKYFLAIAMLINSLACFLIPTFAKYYGSTGVILCRIVQGRWVPVSERSTCGTLVYSGASIGIIMGMPITGVISASWAGWPASFYFFGALGLLWVCIWCAYGSNKPSEHPLITIDEKNYIEASLGHNKNIEAPTPWKAIFTSLPFWAIIVMSFGQNWGFSALLTNIPTYMKSVMKFEIKENGYVSAAPYLASAILAYILGPIADLLINRNLMSIGRTRKCMNTIGTVFPALALIILSYVPEDHIYLSVGLLIAAVGFNAAILCGFQVNHIDLSPNFGGTLMGIANGSSNIFSIISPLVVQEVVATPTDKSQWRIVFLIASAAYIISNIFYCLFASGEVQTWNSIEENFHDGTNKKVKL